MTIENFDDLPEELKKELSVRKVHKVRDALAARIVRVLDKEEGMSLNEILIALYRNHNKVYKRHTLRVTICRLAKQGDVVRVSRGYWRKA